MEVNFGTVALGSLFLFACVAMVLVPTWLSYKVNRGLQVQNHKLLQTVLGLSASPNAVGVAMALEQTERARVESEKEQALAANGIPANGRPHRMPSRMES